MQKTRYQSGSTLVELLIAGAILLVAAAGASSFLLQMSGSLGALKAITESDGLTRRLVNMIDNPKQLLNTFSLPENATLQACAQTLSTCSVVVPIGISLVDQHNATKKLTGQPGNPVFYSKDGEACQGTCNADKYPLEALSAFTGKPSGIQIFFCIRKRNAKSVSALSFAKAKGDAFADSSFMPSCKVFYSSQTEMEKAPPIQPQSYRPADHVLRKFPTVSANKVCAIGLMTGISANGTPICRQPQVWSGGFCLPVEASIPNSNGNTFCALTAIDDDTMNGARTTPDGSGKCQLLWYGAASGWTTKSMKGCGEVGCAYSCIKFP